MNTISLALQHFDAHKGEYLEDLNEMIRIPSVGADPACAPHMRRSAEKVAEVFRRRGLENVEVLDVDGANPYAYGDWLHAPGKPTVLCYAHHDVQPAGDESRWVSPPFEPTVRSDGRLYGRGSADDKAGISVVTAAIDACLKAGKSLPLNVKLMVEGEEEIGSEHLPDFLKKYRSRLDADVMVITDSGNFDTGIPAITTSLRGLAACEVTVRALKQSVHSGSWGGPTPDAVMALCKILASVVDESGDLAIPGIFDKVRPLSEVERKDYESLPMSDEEFRKQAGLLPSVKPVGRAKNYFERLWRIPSFSINAIEAASMKTPRNVIVDVASAHIGIRTVPDMDGDEVLAMLKAHLQKHAPWGVEVTINKAGTGAYWTTDIAHPAFAAAKRALQKGYARPAVMIGQGGSIPFVGPFAAELGNPPALLIGVEDPYTAAHSENESLHLGDWEKTVRSLIYLFEELAALKV
jgi:acetylornithine deacetylase/succinyl-diaminopimelate desuccinylase-like protein